MWKEIGLNTHLEGNTKVSYVAKHVTVLNRAQNLKLYKSEFWSYGSQQLDCTKWLSGKRMLIYLAFMEAKAYQAGSQ